MKLLLLTLAVLAGAFSWPHAARADVIAGYSGSSKISEPKTTFFVFMGTGMQTTDLDSVYLMVNDDDATLFLYNIQLYECDDADYDLGTFSGDECGTPATLYADSLGASYYGVDLAGAGARTPVRMRFASPTWHNAFHCTPGPGCTGTMTQAGLDLDPSKFYYLYFQVDESVADLTPDKSTEVYGITTLLTDLYGNPVFCAVNLTGATNCHDDLTFKTPWTVWTEDEELTAGELVAFGGTASSGVPYWLVPSAFPFAPGASYGLTSSASVSGEDLGFFGNMLRDLALFLFSPWDEATATAWVNFRNSLSVHIPFSYLAEANEMIQAATVASGSMPVWTYSNSNLGLSSISFFSSSTLTAYAPSGFISALRALAVAALWMAALWYVFNEVKYLFG